MASIRSLLTSPALWMIVLILVAGYWIVAWVASIGGPEQVPERYGAIAPLVTGGALFVLTPSPFPGDVISIAHGALYGFSMGALLNWIALWLAVLLEAGIGRRLGVDFNLEEKLDTMPKFIRRFPVGHPLFLILGRQIPIVGSEVTTLIPGALGVPIGRMAWCSAIGIMPAALALSAVGAGLMQL